MCDNCMLTTIDNPYDPFEQFTSWLLFDNEKGYNCSSYLMRIAKIKDSMTLNEKNIEIERAIDDILAHDFIGIYKKVSRKVTVPSDETTETA